MIPPVRTACQMPFLIVWTCWAGTAMSGSKSCKVQKSARICKSASKVFDVWRSILMSFYATLALLKTLGKGYLMIDPWGTGQHQCWHGSCMSDRQVFVICTCFFFPTNPSCGLEQCQKCERQTFNEIAKAGHRLLKSHPNLKVNLDSVKVVKVVKVTSGNRVREWWVDMMLILMLKLDTFQLFRVSKD